MDACRVEMTTPRVLLEAYKLLRIGLRKIAEHRDGIALNAPMVRLLAALGLFDLAHCLFFLMARKVPEMLNAEREPRARAIAGKAPASRGRAKVSCSQTGVTP
jgi:hypothetical protein